MENDIVHEDEETFEENYSVNEEEENFETENENKNAEYTCELVSILKNYVEKTGIPLCEYLYPDSVYNLTFFTHSV